MEATTTLADTLLDDLDDWMDSEEEDEEDPPQPPDSITSRVEGTEDAEENDVKPPALIVSSSASTGSNNLLSTKNKISRSFLENQSLQKHLAKVRQRQLQATRLIKVENGSTQPPQDDQRQQQELDHQLVVQSNRHLAAIAEELGRAHGALAMAYKPKFPELEELLPNYVQYKNAVRCIGNEMDMTKVNDELNEILSSNQIITISVSGSTTSGRPLSEQELQRVDDAADYMEELLQVQQELVDFVEQSMEALAPSICALIGPSTAAKLLGMAGGLAELTKIPACNLQVLGQVKQNSASRAGLSAANTKQHVGILSECDLVRSVPKPLQKKALKVVASKLALAARYDFVNVDTGRLRSAQTGRQLRQEVAEKFEKLQEPDKAPVLKALPNERILVVASSLIDSNHSWQFYAVVVRVTMVLFGIIQSLWEELVMEGCIPTIVSIVGILNSGKLITLFSHFYSFLLVYRPDLEVKKRRGGKRMRRWKERFEETNMMKQANTRAFSSAQGEYGDDAMGITMGLLDTADSGGNIRKTTEKRKMRQANTKASRKRAAVLTQRAQNKDGLATSVVFSQSTSMELVNPDANKDRVREANQKWFKDSAGFQSALPPKGK